jgi:MFS superfamily sulfate permease-like transporter
VSLAYATLAGLPPQYGIYCYLAGGLFYALFGSSRQLAIAQRESQITTGRNTGSDSE